MSHVNYKIGTLLKDVDLGNFVAESDTVLNDAWVQTSAYSDLLDDRVDIIPGTKGSGKSAIFLLLVNFKADEQFKNKKVVVAHGIDAPGDPVFHAFSDTFKQFTEEEFVSFWCIYLVSLANAQFIRGERYADALAIAASEIDLFRRACAEAQIPEIEASRSLKDVLDWAIRVFRAMGPKICLKPPVDFGELEIKLGNSVTNEDPTRQGYLQNKHPQYVNEIKDKLDFILKKCGLSLWLLVDRLDELFPRRSELERIALRGILRAARHFSSSYIWVKIFLRDDVMDQVASGGFTALTHVTARQANTLCWRKDQLLAMMVKRFFPAKQKELARYLEVATFRLNDGPDYQKTVFDKIFPPTMTYGGSKVPAFEWIYEHCADGRGVVTPRDVLLLLIRAKGWQQEQCLANPNGKTEDLISAEALCYGWRELSVHKRQTYLQAEFPHFWRHMQKFHGGQCTYTAKELRKKIGRASFEVIESLLAIGFISRGNHEGNEVYTIPLLYRHGMDIVPDSSNLNEE